MLEEKFYLFVYGTLRNGLYNNHYLRGARFLGLGRTVEQYVLFVGKYPYVQRVPEGSDTALTRVRGEVYVVDKSTLAAVDVLEEHPDTYRREIVEIELDKGGMLPAWLYFHPRPSGRRIASGDVFEVLDRPR